MTTSRLSVRFWGVRGSIAVSGPEFASVGGNTTCVEVHAGDERIILDAGTGVFALGRSLTPPVRATFLFSHFHWDHIQGLPLFRPAYVRGNRFALYAPGASGEEVEAVFASQMQPPNFPVPLAALGADLRFAALLPGDEIIIGPVHVRTAPLRHPQPCLGYRIQVGDASVVYATDTELDDLAELDAQVMDLVRGADVLIHDAQYTTDEYDGHDGVERRGWGHSTYEVACHLARCAGVKQLVLFHHDPSHDDGSMDDILASARTLFAHTVAAREGMSLRIDAGGVAVIDAQTSPPLSSSRARHAA